MRPCGCVAVRYHNITTKVCDRNQATGKTASFDGVIVDAPCSGVGTWRRHPDARWAVTAAQLPELAAEQRQALDLAGTRVRPGGTSSTPWRP